MEPWKKTANLFLIIVILSTSLAIIANYIEHKNDVYISPDDLKQLRRRYFIFSMLTAVWLLYIHISRFFN